MRKKFVRIFFSFEWTLDYDVPTFVRMYDRWNVGTNALTIVGTNEQTTLRTNEQTTLGTNAPLNDMP
jgi:hypothetical protein